MVAAAAGTVQHVGGSDEHHLREVVEHVEVVVAERVVLFGIETSSKAPRIAPEVGAELSISSSMMTGLTVPAFFIDWIRRPGSAPT